MDLRYRQADSDEVLWKETKTRILTGKTSSGQTDGGISCIPVKTTPAPTSSVVVVL